LVIDKTQWRRANARGMSLGAGVVAHKHVFHSSNAM
jgi:hypothetical protein